MKTVIVTGHTKGLGLYIYNHFIELGYNVIGMSSSNGFDINQDIGKIIETVISTKCDYFFNNAYSDVAQAKLIELLAPLTLVITSGSMGSDEYQYRHSDNPYYYNKYVIEQTHKKIKKNNILPMLLLKMGYLENYPDKEPITYSEVLNAIDFWLNNTRVSMIEMENINHDKNFK
jgi:hypothetical protein